MLFNLKGSASLRTMNVTRGSLEEPNSNVVIKIEMANVPPETVCAAIGSHDTRDLLNGLYCLDGDEKAGKPRSLRLPGIGYMKAGGKWDDKHVLTIDDEQHRCARVGNIQVKALPGCTFGVICNIRIEDPTGELLLVLSQHLNADIDIDLAHDAELELPHNADEHEASEQRREAVSQPDLKAA